MGAASDFPPIPEPLLAALDRIFPEASAKTPDQTISYLMFRGGERSVIRFLQRVFQEQQAAAKELSQHVLVQPPRS